MAADSNGLFHGLGDHASNSFSVDGQSITDQQSKVFSNQLPSDAIQSIEVISGAPPAEYGGKTSLVIVATTRSGQGVTKPTGNISTSYGSFGSATAGFDLAYGGKNWGNFIEADGLNTGRFLDPPEFAVFHDKGNEQNVFDRVDYSFTPADSIHLDLNYSRSWFQTPNSYDNLNVQNVVSGGASANPVFGNVGNTDQRSKIGTFNISPTYTRVISNNSVFNLGAFVRRDDYNYYPSGNPLADLGPANLQTSSISQYRTLTNAAVHSDFSYAKGIHNLKIGAQYGQTFLRENDSLGVVDATYNSPCVDVDGNPLAGLLRSFRIATASCRSRIRITFRSSRPTTLPAAASIIQLLRPYRREGTGPLHRRPDQGRQLALQPGPARGRLQRPHRRQPGGAARGHCDTTSSPPAPCCASPMRAPWRRPSTRTWCCPAPDARMRCWRRCWPALRAFPGRLHPGFRNEFHAGLQQAFGKWVVVSGEYIWKYTHNAFDFSILGNTPIYLPHRLA